MTMTLAPLTGLTVLYDEDCVVCRRFGAWLGAQSTYVPVILVPAGSRWARRLFPDLDHERTLTEVTVVGDRGEVWTKEHAWVMCLWATVAHRALAERLATPTGLPLARAAAHAAARLRESLAADQARTEGGDYADRCVGSCAPLPQG